MANPGGLVRKISRELSKFKVNRDKKSYGPVSVMVGCWSGNDMEMMGPEVERSRRWEWVLGRIKVNQQWDNNKTKENRS